MQERKIGWKKNDIANGTATSLMKDNLRQANVGVLKFIFFSLPLLGKETSQKLSVLYIL